MKKKKATCNQRIIVCDFETTTEENDCRVWAVGCYDIASDEFWYYNNIDDFMSLCATIYYNDKIYFHNEKFDGDFIMNWLFRHGLKIIKKWTQKHLQPLYQIKDSFTAWRFVFIVIIYIRTK
mgnify:CR=1 FL=1